MAFYAVGLLYSLLLLGKKGNLLARVVEPAVGFGLIFHFVSLVESTVLIVRLSWASIHYSESLLAFVAMGTSQIGSAGFLDGFKGILIYLLVYTFMNLGAFAVITSLRHRNIAGDDLDDLNGLYSRAPVEAVLMLIFMLSLAGIPPLAGFASKDAILTALEGRAGWIPWALLLATAFLTAFYMGRVLVLTFLGKPTQAGAHAHESSPVMTGPLIAPLLRNPIIAES